MDVFDDDTLESGDNVHFQATIQAPQPFSTGPSVDDSSSFNLKSFCDVRVDTRSTCSATMPLTRVDHPQSQIFAVTSAGSFGHGTKGDSPVRSARSTLPAYVMFMFLDMFPPEGLYHDAAAMAGSAANQLLTSDRVQVPTHCASHARSIRQCIISWGIPPDMIIGLLTTAATSSDLLPAREATWEHKVPNATQTETETETGSCKGKGPSGTLSLVCSQVTPRKNASLTFFP